MKILIIGAGAYGLALSNILTDKNEVTIYSSIKEEIEILKNTNKNEKIFPDITLQNIKYINQIEEQYDLTILALPTKIIEQELNKIKDNIKDTPMIITSKGIYNNKFPYEIVKEILKTENISIISGPSFAKDVIKKEPISLTLAPKNIDIFNEKYVKIETTKDILGLELCGTLKNIFAIGSGILAGMDKSESTKAAYLTKIINETKEIIKKLGGDENTILLSCGIGDIILTCTSSNSRNYTLGYKIGKQEPIQEYINQTTIEGLNALKEYKKLLQETPIEIINILYEIIYNNQKPEILIDYIVKKA